ncbi:MAG: TIGR02300 family protein, partial [Nitrobacter sp.]
MAKSELGTKRICPTTGKKFYDLNKTPVISPYTGDVVPIVVAPPARVRGEAARAAAAAASASEAAPEPAEVEEVSLEEADAEEKTGKVKTAVPESEDD